MAAMNDTYIEKFHNIFPELSYIQLKTVLFYCYGLGREEVADLRKVSVPAVDKSLTTCRKLLNVESLGQLRTVVLMRISASLLVQNYVD